MRRRTAIVLLLLSAAWAGTKEKKEKISIRILDSISTAVLSGHVAGTNAYAATSCGTSGTTNIDASATDLGNGMTSVSGTGNARSSTNCQTVYHDATPGHDTYVTHVGMMATIPALNKDVLLWCAVEWRQCEALSQGTYDAEMKDDIVWIYVFGGARPSKIKYRIVNPALLGLPPLDQWPKDSSQNKSEGGSSEPLPQGCSAKDSHEQCQAVMNCMRSGGTANYCEMFHGALGQ